MAATGARASRGAAAATAPPALRRPAELSPRVVSLDQLVISDETRDSWAEWIEKYSRGEYPLDKSPPEPIIADDVVSASTTTAVAQSPDVLQRDFGAMVDLGTVQSKDTFLKKRYLAAPIGPHEEDRRRVLQRFGLRALQPGRQAIDKVADMAQAFFKVPIVVISVVLDDREIFASTIGWSEHERDPGFRRRIEIPLETALCPHAMTKMEDSECFVLENTAEDWRFANNPYVSDGGPIAFFASANIFLPTAFEGDPTRRNAGPSPSRMPVGSVCIVEREPRKKGQFSPEEATFLKGCADMVGREIELSYQRDRERIQTAQSDFLGEFLRASLVRPSWDEDDSPAKPTVEDAAFQLQTLVNATTVAFLDLRSFQSPRRPSSGPETPSTPQATNGETKTAARPTNVRQASFLKHGRLTTATRTLSGLATGQGVISVLASSGNFDWATSVSRPGANEAVSRFIVANYADNECEFDERSMPSPLGSVLPPEAKASISIPICDVDGRPALLVVVCSTVAYFRFEPSDRQFAESLGAVAVGGLLRRRILEADKAKLAFLSQVTHELLTPLHGVRGQLDLIRTVAQPNALKTIKPLLDVADVCVSSLREILDDTLDYSKLSHADARSKSDRVEVDLQSVLEEVIKACWARARQQALLTPNLSKEVVDIILDYQLPPGRRWLVDIGGLKRLLFNLCGNSLKFTKQGNVTVTVTQSSQLSRKELENGTRTVEITISDTGCGMSLDFVREGLFVPFKQADSFSQGAGLGISICDHIINRMAGTLRFESTVGVGTTAFVTLPLTYVDVPQAKGEAVIPQQPRIVSEELSRLFHPTSFSNHADDDPAISPVTSPRQNGSSTLAHLPESANPFEVRVLVVEDNYISRTLLTTFLTKKGVRWAQALDGQESVEVFESFRPNLVWCDIQMPVMDGVTATALMRVFEVKHNLVPAYIVALSGLSSELSRNSSALESGQINEWLVKGGPNLKTLGVGLERMQAEMAHRKAKVEALELAVANIRNGRRASLAGS